MKLCIQLSEHNSHSETVTCIAWVSPDEFISCSDDRQLLLWNATSLTASKLADLRNDVYPTAIHGMPPDFNKKISSVETFLLASADGKFYLMSKTGRIERSVEAHKGAIIAIQWSHDGTNLATAGEDGTVKIWSRSGMLRSTLVQATSPVYSIAWGPRSMHILYSVARNLSIKSLAPAGKPVQWKAHDGWILTVSWSSTSNWIISGAEDCRYKVWDHQGNPLYSSPALEFPIVSVAWTPDADLFLVGSHNALRLCDARGWCHSLEKPNDTGSLYSVSWSHDGTLLAAGCGNGRVVAGYVIDRRLEWKNYEAVIINQLSINLTNVLTDVTETFDYKDRILRVSFQCGHLVAATAQQCYIHSERNWSSAPIVFDIREGGIRFLLQSEKHLLLVDTNAVSLYTYEGRHTVSPKLPGLKTVTLTPNLISLSPDTLALRDSRDLRVIHFYDLAGNKWLNGLDNKPWSHTQDIVALALDQNKERDALRRLAYVDINNDLYLTVVPHLRAASTKPTKLGIRSLIWHSDVCMLAALQDDTAHIWFYPAIVDSDPSLLARTVYTRETADSGKNLQLERFEGTQAFVRRGDGAQIVWSVSAFPGILQAHVHQGRWEDAARLCNLANMEHLWACFAGMAMQFRKLDLAEMAYANLNENDKVLHLQYIKSLPKAVGRAELALLGGNRSEAENILLQAGLVFRAILLDIHCYEWERALDLAVKHRIHVETVLAHRQQYLEHFGHHETNAKFIRYSKEVDVDWEQVKEKMAAEFDKEKMST